MAQSIVLLPLIGFIISCVISFLRPHKNLDLFSQVITCTFVVISAVFSFYIFLSNLSDPSTLSIKIFTWISSGDFTASWSIYLDSVTRVMLVVITSVSALVHVYSIGYMSHDDSKPRFMGYLSLFTFAMLMLVTADNFLQLFFGWEGVGLASYLLIGFWYKKPAANSAAIKAFVVNRVGDFGLALGIFAIYVMFGSIDYQTVFEQAEQMKDKDIFFIGYEIHALTLICCLLFVGAMGKSAQLFLHTWLPDAMEGPTPVSALIHAATMVTAGVFLVVRCSPIFDLSPIALDLVVLVGASTAFFAATIGLVQNDIKRIIAYSTCSQLGYMFVAAGLGAYGIAMFHLFTHAFFKALLFLGAGSVIHSVHEEQDIRKMGGISKFIPLTHLMMIIGTISLMGFPFTSGYYSKDAIIETAYLSDSSYAGYAYYLLTVGVFMTSFYSWRLIFMVFNGKTRMAEEDFKKVHESSSVMIIPLIFLSVGALSFGYLFKSYFMGSYSDVFWDHSIAHHHGDHHDIPLIIYYMPAIVGIFGLITAWYMYLKNTKLPNNIAQVNKPLYQFLLNKWYFDELYNLIFVKPAMAFGRFAWKLIDGYIIDGFGPNGIASTISRLSIRARQMQSGLIYHYAFAILIGLSFLITFFIFTN